MNKSKLLVSSILFLALGLAAAGCEKSADLGRMQEETLGMVKLHAAQVELLQRRSEAMMTRGRSLGGDVPGLAEAGRLLSEARAGLDQLRALLAASPTTMANAVKSAEVDEVARASNELIEKLDAGEIAVRANLAAVDNWLMGAENRPRVATPPAPPAPPAPTETPVPAPGSGSAAGSAAPQN